MPEIAADAPELTARRTRYTTRTIMTAAAIGAAVGVVLIPLNFVTAPIQATLPILAVAVYGVWGIAALVPLALLRRAGTGVIGATAAGLVSSISPYGLFMVVMMIGWGLFMELPFAMARYRHFGWRMFVAAGAVAGALSCAMSWAMLDLGSLSPTMAIAICAVQLASFVACSALSLVIAHALGRAGISGVRRRTAGDD